MARAESSVLNLVVILTPDQQRDLRKIFDLSEPKCPHLSSGNTAVVRQVTSMVPDEWSLCSKGSYRIFPPEEHGRKHEVLPGEADQVIIELNLEAGGFSKPEQWWGGALSVE